MKQILTFLCLLGIHFSFAQSNLAFTSTCENLTFCNTTSNCGDAPAQFSVTATTDCSPVNDILIAYQIDLNNDGSFEMADAGSTIDDTFPMGTHLVLFVAEDQCGGYVTCEFLFEIADCTPPTPVMFFGIATTFLNGQGEVTILASDFNSNSSDNCTAESDLIFSFSEDITEVSKTLTCFDPNDNGLYPLEIYVTDAAGNADFGSTFININDPNDLCNFVTNPPLGLSAVTPDEKLIQDVVYSVDGLINPNGDFVEGNIVTPSIDENYLNGVTTYDIVLISKHISGDELFTEDWQLEAADVSLNGAISIHDMIIMRSLILHITDEFPSGSSWGFIPEQYTIPADFTSFQFLGYKYGDLNGSAHCLQGEPQATTRTTSTLNLQVKNQAIKKGTTYTIPTFAKNFNKVSGGQFTLKFDASALDFEGVSEGDFEDITTDNFGATQTAEGLILCSWVSGNSATVEADQALYNITFTAKKDGDLSDFISINSSVIEAEAYVDNGGALDFWEIELAFENEPNAVKTISVFPNPFNTQTALYFSLEKAGNVSLEVYDVNGRLLIAQEKNMAEGEHQFDISKRALNATGVYFYKLKTSESVNTGKLILE